MNLKTAHADLIAGGIFWHKTLRFIHKPHIFTSMHWLVLFLRYWLWLRKLGIMKFSWNSDFSDIFWFCKLRWCPMFLFFKYCFKNLLNSVIHNIIFSFTN